MPYHLKKNTKVKSRKKWLIVRDEDGIVVGSSSSKKKAIASIGYRIGGERSKSKVRKVL